MIVYSHINGISLNGRQYLLDNLGNVVRFRNENEVKEYLGIDPWKDLEDFGIYTEEEEAETA